jgi:hypothetical protein
MVSPGRVVAGLTLIAIASGMVVWQSEHESRRTKAAARIRALADDINISGIEVRPTYRIGPARDPVKEAVYELRAIVTAEIAADYEKCAGEAEPTVAAKRFLEALAETLSSSHLR